MANSPSLNIPLVAENQAAKEATINTAFLRFEGATQRSKVVTFTSNAATLSNTDFTSYFRFKCNSLTAAGTLTIPQEIVTGAPTERFFIVTNNSTFSLTVEGDAAGSVVVSPASSGFIYSDGTSVSTVSVEIPFTYTLDEFSDVSTPAPTNNQFLRYVTANNRWEAVTVSIPTSFLGLTDTPANYTGSGGKALRVSGVGNNVEFFTLNLNSITDVDTTTVAPTDGQVLTWDDTASKWIPESPTGGGAESLDDLTDVDLTTPATDGQVLAWDEVSGTFLPIDADAASYPSFTGNTGKVLAVNATEDGVEWKTDATGGGGGGTPTTKSLYSTANVRNINFEANAIPADWTQISTAGFTVVAGSIVTKTGLKNNLAFRFGTIANNQKTGYEFTTTVPAGGGSISVTATNSSEIAYDYLEVYANGVLIGDTKSNTVETAVTETYALTAGVNTIQLVYVKDTSGAVADDTVYIHNIDVASADPAIVTGDYVKYRERTYRAKVDAPAAAPSLTNADYVVVETAGEKVTDLGTVAAGRRLIATDIGKTLLVSASGALTIPADFTPIIGATINVVATVVGSAQVTFTAGAGVTLNSTGGLGALRVQYSSATLIQTAANVWLLVGDLA